MGKRIFTALLGVIVMSAALLSASTQAKAASRTVSVQLPEFAVTVDGQPIDSKKLKYPLLEYEDMTYFPMTANVGKGMGLRIQWSADDGLHIDSMTEAKTEKLAMEAGGVYKFDRTYEAQVVNDPVIVNSLSISNASEPYPLLTFNDITYFPMTWFAHDMFGWETGWNKTAGLTIRTSQKPYITNIVYDDDRYLYALSVEQGGMFRISKDLLGTPAYLNVKESAPIQQQREALYNQTSPESVELELKNDMLSYKGTKLFSVTSYYEKNKAFYDEHPREQRNDKAIDYWGRQVAIDEHTTLISVKLFYATVIPAPYTPHEEQTYLIRDGKATKLDGFTQWIDGYAKAAEGTWIWSYSPDYVRVSNSEARGQVMWIGANGESKLFNELMNAQYTAMLHTYGDEAIVNAYTLIGSDKLTEGYFRVKADGTYAKIADMPPRDESFGHGLSINSYADADGNLYLTGLNKVSNSTAGSSKTWWDYELLHEVAAAKNQQ